MGESAVRVFTTKGKTAFRGTIQSQTRDAFIVDLGDGKGTITLAKSYVVAIDGAPYPKRRAKRVLRASDYVVFVDGNAYGNTCVELQLHFAQPVTARDVIEAAVPEALRHNVTWVSPRVLAVSATDWYGLDDEPTDSWMRAYRRAVAALLETAHRMTPLTLVYATNALDVPALRKHAKADLPSALPVVCEALEALWATASLDELRASQLTYEMLRGVVYERHALTDSDRARLAKILERAARSQPAMFVDIAQDLDAQARRGVVAVSAAPSSPARAFGASPRVPR